MEFVLCFSRPSVFVAFGVIFLVQVPFGDMRANLLLLLCIQDRR